MSTVSTIPNECFEALTLTERLSANRPPLNRTGSGPADHPELVRWRKRSKIREASLFEERLRRAGLDSERLLAILEEPSEQLRERVGDLPPWLVEMDRLWDLAEARPPSDPPYALKRKSKLVAFAAPLLADRERQLSEGLQRLSTAHGPGLLSDTLASGLMRQLEAEVETLSMRVLAAELEHRRESGTLVGETSEDRFKHVVEWAAAPGQNRRFFSKYPLLGRALIIRTALWLKAVLELVERFATDRTQLVTAFGPDLDGPLERIKLGLGDPHRGGHTVCRLHFPNGGRVIYKPRGLGVERHFYSLQRWLGERLPETDFWAPQVLDRGAYGWVEFVRHGPCPTWDGVRRFFYRQGANLALLHALEARDMHNDNVIAVGEHPVLIDLETLFTPMDPEQAGESAEQRLLGSSVMGTLLLPQRIFGDRNRPGVDIGGLGDPDGQVQGGGGAFVLDGVGTDQMRVVREPVVWRSSRNLPLFEDRLVTPDGEYADELLRGFRAAYQTICDHRAALLAPGGPIDEFRADPIRVIIFPTAFYAALLHDSWHPHILCRALERDSLFDRLLAPSGRDPDMLLAMERASRLALERGDIPVFQTTPESRDIATDGDEVLAGYFAQSGLERVRAKIEQFGVVDLELQSWFIRSALVLRPDNEAPLPEPSGRPTADRPSTGADLDRCVRALGDHLLRTAIERQGSLIWVGVIPSTVTARWKQPGPIGLDLHSGRPGIALFLAQLGAHTRQSRYSDAARRIVDEWQAGVRRDPGSLGVGGFTGWGGHLYALARLCRLWHDPQLLSGMADYLRRLEDLLSRDDHHDVISGAAGAILGVRALAAVAPTFDTGPLLAAAADRLLAAAVPDAEGGLCWPSRVGARPLCGYGRGAAGIAHALSAAGHLTGDARYSQAARAAVNFERTLYDRERRNWPDRRQGEADGYRLDWCHGAAGVGLGRVALWRRGPEALLEEEIATAIEACRLQRPSGRLSACDGDLGHLELLREASVVLGRRELEEEMWTVAGGLVGRIEQMGVGGTGALPLVPPGFLWGVAGVGYSLLRVLDPELAPSVLLHELGTDATSPSEPRQKADDDEGIRVASRGGETKTSSA